MFSRITPTPTAALGPGFYVVDRSEDHGEAEVVLERFDYTRTGNEQANHIKRGLYVNGNRGATVIGIPPAGDFNDIEVVLIAADDPRVLAPRTDGECFSFQLSTGPIYLVIRRGATDRQLAEASCAHHVDLEKLRSFRDSQLR